MVRDIGEIRENKVAIFGRGVMPMPGGKENAVPVNIPIVAGGINVNPGDVIVADEEGVAVIPKEKAEEIYTKTKTNVEKEKTMSFEQWAANHKDKIDSFYK